MWYALVCYKVCDDLFKCGRTGGYHWCRQGRARLNAKSGVQAGGKEECGCKATQGVDHAKICGRDVSDDLMPLIEHRHGAHALCSIVMRPMKLASKQRSSRAAYMFCDEPKSVDSAGCRLDCMEGGGGKIELCKGRCALRKVCNVLRGFSRVTHRNRSCLHVGKIFHFQATKRTAARNLRIPLSVTIVCSSPALSMTGIR